MVLLIWILLLLAVLVSGKRKNSCILVHEDYRYNRNKTFKNFHYWRCCKRKECNGSVTTNKFDLKSANPDIRIERSVPHNHAPQSDLVYASNALREMTDAVKRD